MPLTARIAQARESTLEIRWRLLEDLIHPGVLRYMREIGLLK